MKTTHLKNTSPMALLLNVKAWTMKAITSAAFVLAASHAYSASLEGFTTICTLDENCAVEDSTLVAFGSQQQYTYKTLSGGFICAAKTFGLSTKVVPSSTCLVLDKSLANGSVSSSSSGTLTDDAEKAAGLASGQYAIISLSSGKALTIKDSDLDDGALLVQQDFEQQVNQIWDVKVLGNGFYSITAFHSQKALESQDSNNRDGANLQQFTWVNDWKQHWAIQPIGDGYFRINSRFNGQVVDLYEMNKKNNGEVCLWTYWGGNNQHWRFVAITDEPDAEKVTTDTNPSK